VISVQQDRNKMLTKEELNYLNSHYPITLTKVQHIIDRVHLRYPTISRLDLTIIVKEFFSSMREIVSTGNSISINGFFSFMKLISFVRIYNNKEYFMTKMQVKSPRIIK
jgi:hypothetical protein